MSVFNYLNGDKEFHCLYKNDKRNADYWSW